MKKQYPSFVVIIVVLLFVLCGVSLIGLLGIQLNPSSSLSSFTITYSWPDAEARVIEQEVTSRLEALCAGVKGVKMISSKSENEEGNIQIQLDKKVDIDAIRFEISALIRQIWPNLPKGVSYPQINSNNDSQDEEIPLISYSISAPSSPHIIQKYTEDFIKPILSQIPGIHKIEVFGAGPMEWQIIYDTQMLDNLHITSDEIQRTLIQQLKRENLGLSNGLFPMVLKPKNLPSDLLSDQVERYLSSLPILKTNNHIVFLGNIARIFYTEAQVQSYYRVNGLNTINVVIYGSSGEKNLTLNKTIKEAIEKLSAILPTGYELILSYDSTEYIRTELFNIGIRTIFAFSILLLFVFIVSQKIKHVVLILITLLTNLSIAVIFFYFFHVEIHLYALAGLTVSFGLMTDNIIIMSYHLRTQGNFKAWLAIFAGTLATISAVTIIFFLDEHIKTNLKDFALIIIINQSVSLFTVLFFVPAIMDVLKLNKSQNNILEKSLTFRKKTNFMLLKSKKRRALVYINTYQKHFLQFRKHKFIPLIILILGFGLPVYLLPKSLKSDNWYSKAYNKTLGSMWYNENARPWVDKILGGSLRLFAENVFDGSYFINPQETSLIITASMPNGTTLQQMNALVNRMENYLKKYSGIRLFNTFVSTRRANINIYFKREFQASGFPYQLKNQIISKAVQFGGADWGVFGIGDGFSNSIHETAGNYSIELLGYNYDHLSKLTEELKDNLMENRRIKEVYIQPELSWYKPDDNEFFIRLDPTQTAILEISPHVAYTSIQNLCLGSLTIATLQINDQAENIKLGSQQAMETNMWQLVRLPRMHDTTWFKLANFSYIEKQSAIHSVCKENQQYKLYLQFDYIGAAKFAQKYIDKTLGDFRKSLPIGYSVDSDSSYWYWQQQNKNHYWYLLLIIVMIYFICAVLFESLLQPLAVILTIPIAYIGVFLTFYLFDLNFDQGGFAAFIMLSGITVNTSIYLLNDFNNLKKYYRHRKISIFKIYFKAFSYKVFPILLTIIATILGFVPFLVGEKQPFWFTLATGTIGGIVFSIIGVVLYLPFFLGIGKNENLNFEYSNKTNYKLDKSKLLL